MFSYFSFSSFAGPEHGTLRNALSGILGEAICLSEIHLRVKNHLDCGEFQELEIWKKVYTILNHSCKSNYQSVGVILEHFSTSQKLASKQRLKNISKKHKNHMQSLSLRLKEPKGIIMKNVKNTEFY